jgi:thioredoxin reductase (NADPH)
MGLARQKGNRVTLSYRSGEFSRLKDRNLKRMQEHMRSHTIDVIFNSMPTEFRAGSVLLQSGEATRELANDYVWIFAGGTSPTGFLKSAGVEVGSVQAD